MALTTPRSTFVASLSLLAACGALAVACGGDPAAGPGTEADAGGGTDGGACLESGSGTLEIVVTGLPDGEGARVTVTAPDGTPTDATGSTTLAGKPAGTYEITAAHVTTPDPIVRMVYEAAVSHHSFCLEDATTETVTVAYLPVASSHKLWATTRNSAAQVAGFGAADLLATGSPGATVAMKGAPTGGAGKSIAFDKDGNLWALGPTSADAPLVRFPASILGDSGDKTPDRKITPDFGGCVPATGAIAFDPGGSLWVTSPCLDKVLRISPVTLTDSSEFAPTDEDFATGVNDPKQIAFDAMGNMWVSGDGSIHYFPAANLADGQPHVPTFAITPKAENDAPLPPDALAFDAAGNLWVTNFGGNAVYKLTPADLAVAGETKEVVPSVVISITVGALLESLAFDEGGGLWITYGQGKIARLAPEQLGTSTNPGDPTIPETIVTSADLGALGGVALYPAPAGLPLYGRPE
jgi:sugar lactone lactonase YvrE